MIISEQLIVRWLGLQDYLSTWQAMQSFTNTRDASTIDEVWLLEHLPVYTQGQSGKPEHIISDLNHPIVQTDRGGQITYHGPGQLMVYTLVDLKRKKFSIRDIVCKLETSIIDLLSAKNITAQANREAPGVYVAGKKICSIGLRVRRGCVYHGIAFNINMNLKPFFCINPCGFQNLQMTDLNSLTPATSVSAIALQLVQYIKLHLGYNVVTFEPTLQDECL